MAESYEIPPHTGKTRPQGCIFPTISLLSVTSARSSTRFFHLPFQSFLSCFSVSGCHAASSSEGPRWAPPCWLLDLSLHSVEPESSDSSYLHHHFSLSKSLQAPGLQQWPKHFSTDCRQTKPWTDSKQRCLFLTTALLSLVFPWLIKFNLLTFSIYELVHSLKKEFQANSFSQNKLHHTFMSKS